MNTLTCSCGKPAYVVMDGEPLCEPAFVWASKREAFEDRVLLAGVHDATGRPLRSKPKEWEL